MALSAAGAVVVVSGRGGFALPSLPHLLVTLLVPLAVAASLILANPLLPIHGPFKFTMQLYVPAGAGLALVGALVPGRPVAEVPRLPAPGLAAVVELGLVASVVAYLLWFRVLATRSAASVAVWLNLVPVFGLIMDAAVLGEPLGWRVLVGAGLTPAGMRWLQRSDAAPERVRR